MASWEPVAASPRRPAWHVRPVPSPSCSAPPMHCGFVLVEVGGDPGSSPHGLDVLTGKGHLLHGARPAPSGPGRAISHACTWRCHHRSGPSPHQLGREGGAGCQASCCPFSSGHVRPKAGAPSGSPVALPGQRGPYGSDAGSGVSRWGPSPLSPVSAGGFYPFPRGPKSGPGGPSARRRGGVGGQLFPSFLSGVTVVTARVTGAAAGRL